MAEVTATLYRAVICRYFDQSKNKSFGNFGAVIPDMHQWIMRQATIGETCTYEPLEDDDFLRTFCLDSRILKAPGAYLFVTWNELSGTEDGVQVIETDAAIGSAKVSTAELDAMSLPGYPSFFVVLSEDNLILNLRFPWNRLNGSQSFQRYVLGFLQEAAKWAVWDDERFLGYASDGRRVKGEYLPEYKIALARRKTKLAWLRDNVGDIRKIVHRKLIKPVIQEHRDFLDSAFVFLGLKPNKRLRADVDFEYDFKIRLDEDKLEEIIAQFETRDDYDGWTDVGFIMARDSQKKHWLSGSICREKLELAVTNASADMVDVDSLVEVLNDRLEEIVSRVQ